MTIGAGSPQEVRIVVCEKCGVKNRVDADRARESHALCRRCGSPLATGKSGKPGGFTDDVNEGVDARLEAARRGLLALRAQAARHGFEEVTARIDAGMADLDEPLLIFVVGEGNFGKSTLINRLAGKNIAPTARVPKTWRIDLYMLVEEIRNGKVANQWVSYMYRQTP